MALILGLETALSTCSVGLFEDGKLISLTEERGSNLHASHLTPFIEETFNIAERKISELDAVCMSMGPGSYTGLRIGASTAKGLCYALDIPLIAVNTLQALAIKAKGVVASKFYCPMIDARRMEVYFGVYDSEMKEIMPAQPMIVDQSFADILPAGEMLFFGNGMEKCRGFLSKREDSGFLEDIFPSASALAEVAEKKYRQQEFEELASFEPFYLKEFRAGSPKDQLKRLLNK
jgi:tRNA threonylcarbamoyladenosine biosynthesis protein TsaB